MSDEKAKIRQINGYKFKPIAGGSVKVTDRSGNTQIVSKEKADHIYEHQKLLKNIAGCQTTRHKLVVKVRDYEHNDFRMFTLNTPYDEAVTYVKLKRALTICQIMYKMNYTSLSELNLDDISRQYPDDHITREEASQYIVNCNSDKIVNTMILASKLYKIKYETIKDDFSLYF